MKKGFVLILALVACLITIPLFAEDTTSNSTSSTAETVASSRNAQPLYEIATQGLVHISEAELAHGLRSYMGRPYTPELEAGIRAYLNNLKRFSFFDLSTEPATTGKGLKLNIYAIEFPIIDKVVVEGAVAFYKERIENMMEQKHNDVLDKNRLYSDAQLITEKYREKGYPDVQVSVSVAKENKEAGTVDLLVKIDEGYQTIVRAIAFEGNQIVSSDTLSRKISSRTKGFLRYGRFEQGRLAKDKEKLENYYHDRGYLDAKLLDISQNVEVEDGIRYVNLLYKVYEGQAWKLGDITLEGNTVFTDKQLLKDVDSEAGVTINLSRLNRDLQGIANVYLDEGYIFNTIDWQQQRDEQRHVVRYHGVISERPQARIRSIVFKGNKKTKEYVLMREMDLKAGEIFSRKKMIQSLQNLYNTGFVKTATPDMRPLMDGSNELILVINIEEQRTLSLGGALGVSAMSDFPLQLKFDISDKNIAGSGNTFGAGVELSDAQQSFSLSYGQSWIRDKRISYNSSLSIARSMQRGVLQDREGLVFGDQDYLDGKAAPDPYDSYEDYQKGLARHDGIAKKHLMDYRLWQVSAQNGLGYTIVTDVGRLMFSGGLDITIKHVSYDETKFRPFQLAVRENNHRWRFKNVLWASALWDYRDYRYNPRKGVAIRETLSYGGGFLGGVSHFTMSKTDLGLYYPIIRIPRHDIARSTFDIVLRYEGSFSMIMPQYFKGKERWQTGTQLSQEERLMTDGMNVGRGWAPIQDLEVIWNNMFSITMPISEQAIWADIFFNATGYATRLKDMSKMNASNYLYSFGAGVRLVIPSFPFGFYFSKGFSYDHAGNFHWKRGAIFGNNKNPNSGIDFSITVSTTI